MDALNFCYWLQGYFEIQNASEKDNSNISLDSTQITEIKNHLSLVLKKQTPSLVRNTGAGTNSSSSSPPLWHVNTSSSMPPSWIKGFCDKYSSHDPTVSPDENIEQELMPLATGLSNPTWWSTTVGEENSQRVVYSNKEQRLVPLSVLEHSSTPTWSPPYTLTMADGSC